MQTFIHAAYLWLAGIHPLLPWILLTGLPCFVAPWAFRTFAPNTWERMPALVDALCVKLNISLDGFWNKFLGWLTQTLPTAAMAAASGAYLAHIDVKHAFWVAVWDCAAVPLHHVLKDIPWIPYIGGAFPAAGKAAPKAGAKKLAKVAGAGMVFLTLLLPVGLATGTSGCALLAKAPTVLSDAITWEQRIQTILGIVDNAAQASFKAFPPPAKVLADYNKGRAITLTSCDAIIKLTGAGKSLSDKDVQAAIAQALVGIHDIEAALKEAGITVGSKMPAGASEATAGGHFILAPDFPPPPRARK